MLPNNIIWPRNSENLFEQPDCFRFLVQWETEPASEGQQLKN